MIKVLKTQTKGSISDCQVSGFAPQNAKVLEKKSGIYGACCVFFWEILVIPYTKATT